MHDFAIITFIISQLRRLVSSSILMFCLSLHSWFPFCLSNKKARYNWCKKTPSCYYLNCKTSIKSFQLYMGYDLDHKFEFYLLIFKMKVTSTFRMVIITLWLISEYVKFWILLPASITTENVSTIIYHKWWSCIMEFSETTHLRANWNNDDKMIYIGI